MSVKAVTSLEEQRPVGDVWPIVVDVLDADGFRVGVAPTVTVTAPDGTTSTPAVESTIGGCWRALYTITAAGRHIATAAESSYGSVDFVLTAVAASVAGAMPGVADVTKYLGDNSWDTAEIADVLAAEAEAQRALCAVPAYYPADLKEALLRRTARNLSMRRVPLAQPIGDAEAGGTTIPAYDPEIRRLEKPHYRLLVA